MSKIICGVDVDSRFLQARIGPNGPAGRFANTAKGIAKLAEFCHQHQVELVAMEATGGYEKRPFALGSGRGDRLGRARDKFSTTQKSVDKHPSISDDNGE